MNRIPGQRIALGTIKGEWPGPFIGGTKLARQNLANPSLLLSSRSRRVDLSSKLAFRSGEIVETEEWR
ncbi:hypothetical protein TNCT_242461 [Trichonephila clavata]|uniref:Uncharacterized protein n=1 Tax=Trichonephila clavata TaxID=2740835 RepID=A0A8X6KRP9_TRICU|nr:hypothetical protein TNCT_242461 [Trichonephila clavata]